MKKILSLVLVGIFCLSIVGCGNNKNNKEISEEDIIRVGDSAVGFIDLPREVELKFGESGMFKAQMDDSDSNRQAYFIMELGFGDSAEKLMQNILELNSNREGETVIYSGPFTSKNVSGYKIIFHDNEFFTTKYMFETNGRLIYIFLYANDGDYWNDVIDTYRFER